MMSIESKKSELLNSFSKSSFTKNFVSIAHHLLFLSALLPFKFFALLLLTLGTRKQKSPNGKVQFYKVNSFGGATKSFLITIRRTSSENGLTGLSLYLFLAEYSKSSTFGTKTDDINHSPNES